MREKTKQAENNGSNIQFLIHIAVVILVTKAEWTDGIHQEPSALWRENLLLSLRKNHFNITLKIQVKTGINKICSLKKLVTIVKLKNIYFISNIS